ncbi:arsenic transporter [Ectobacillus panaciterrae]|uniref:arsenic transporter n=1 Tax=Ectobacillus panaciterrae TaxID=363872 RepID=UPI0003FB3FFF|nr:arsenic transporter [Ectobacillus panaciterrae]
MLDAKSIITVLLFLVTMCIIFWRPKQLNEAIPASVGACLVLLTGTVSMQDLFTISEKVSGAALIIIATIVMAVVLESFGFFYWAAAVLVNWSKGSGIRLFWLTNLLCFLMTLFFNNDGSILITTPILLLLFKHMRLKQHQKIPYLVSGALVATASSAPIGVSNIVNLIALKIVNMDLYSYTAMMFVPVSLGLLFLAALLFVVYYKDLPKVLPRKSVSVQELIQRPRHHHPQQAKLSAQEQAKQVRFMRNILFFVLAVRIGLFVASYYGVPIEIVAVVGSLMLLAWRWYKLRQNPLDILRKAPWHILVFAFAMYILIYGLRNIGLTDLLVHILKPVVSHSLLYTSVVMGSVLSILSNIFNNHPALMIGTITLTEMGLGPLTLKVMYLANIVGSDIGALLLPIGTLATLIWMGILRKEKVSIRWGQYIRVTIIVIPLTVLFTLLCLYYWIAWFFT